MSEQNNIWMPYKEYIAFQDMRKKLEAEKRAEMAYFFWNNFSHKGYEEWKINNDKQTNSIPNTES